MASSGARLRPMRPDERGLDEEIRGHLAINIRAFIILSVA